MATVHSPVDATSTEGGKENVQGIHPSPTSVSALAVDVNSPPRNDSQYTDNNSKRNRRRRKGKARGNQVEPVSSHSPRPRNHQNNQKKKNSHNNSNGYNNNENEQRSSSFRSPIGSWSRSKGPRNNNNNRYNNNHNNRQGNKNNWNHPSPRINRLNNSPACPASTGYPTSKKQHDAPMKKRDLYFALHVEQVGIESNDRQKTVARVTLTNWDNEFVLDSFVAISVPVTDFYETGIKPENLQLSDENGAKEGSTVTFAAVRSKVERILKGKILIGYDLEVGLKALGLSHPDTDMRDCSAYFSQKEAANVDSGVALLESLSQKELNRPFQSAKAKLAKDSKNDDVMSLGKDSSASRKPMQICVTTMDLYKRRRKEWETDLIAQARERDRQQQDYLLKISQQRQQEQQEARMQTHAKQQARQQQYHENMMSVSIHCEMVRTALTGRTKTVARVTMMDGLSRNILLDEFVHIPVPVTDFCDTGVTERDVSSRNAMPLGVLRGHVERILHGKLLVGYKVEECLKALGLPHHWMNVRDIAFFPPFLHQKLVGGSTSVVTVRSLDELSETFLRQILRPVGDLSRPLDLCHSILGLYESFHGQFEQQSRSQQQDTFHHQQQVHRVQRPMMPSTHVNTNSYYGQQDPAPRYNSATMMPPPSHQQLQQQDMLYERQEQQYPDVQYRQNSTSSSWFPTVGSQTLSTQALQVLQEDFSNRGDPAPRSHFLPLSAQSQSSAFDARTNSFDGSEFSGAASDLFTESVISSLREDTSSVMSGDHLPTERKSGSSSWFRFSSKKSKDKARNDGTHCETMACVQETEVLNDGGVLPLPVELFPSSHHSNVDTTPLKTASTEGKEDEDRSSPSIPRSWFGLRKSPVQRDRSHSPSSSFSHSTIEDLSMTARIEGLADAKREPSIEITLSMPASEESVDTIASLLDKSATTSLPSRPNSSWIGKLRSLKSSGSKSSSKSNALGNEPAPDLKPAPTDNTTTMEAEDWLQEVMSQSTTTTQDLEPWMNGHGEAKTTELSEKQSGDLRGQASWFGFKRSKATKMSRLVSLDTTKEDFKAEAASEDGTWSDAASTGGYWLPEDGNSFAGSNNGSETNAIFHPRARLPTESTIPSVTTEELEEEHSDSGSFSNDLDFGAAQSFNFLKI